MLKWWEQKPWTTFVVLGNHCNYEAIEKLPTDIVFGAPVRRVNNSIVIAETGNIYNLCGKECLVINGADSHDRIFRKEGISWWEQERITQDDINKALISLAQHNNEVDFIFSHTGGTEVCNFLGYKATPSDIQLQKILDTIAYEHSYCGHYHCDKIVNTKQRIVYNDIIMIVNEDDKL